MTRQVSYLEAPLMLWNGERRGASYDCGQSIEVTGWYEVCWDDSEHRVTLTPTETLVDDDYLVWHHGPSVAAPTATSRVPDRPQKPQPVTSPA